MKRGINNKLWKYAKITAVLFTIFAVVLSGCVDKEQNAGNTTNNSQGISETNNSQGTSGTKDSQGTSGGDYVYGAANVESVQIITLESFPVQIQAIAEGYLPDGCTEIDKVKTEREGHVFNINISTKRPKDAVCTQAIESFTETIPLEVRGLEAGNYTVNVNGATRSFELPVDNVQQVIVQPVITEADNGTNISLEKGSIFFLKLKENPTTGYSWELNLSQGLSNISGQYYPAKQHEGVEHPLVGAGGVHLWEIKVVADGNQQVKGIYKRPWESETGTEEKFTLNVEVV